MTLKNSKDLKINIEDITAKNAVSECDAAFSDFLENESLASKEEIPEFKEYECKLKTKKKELSLDGYRYYDKSLGYRFITFCHRAVANFFLKLYLKIFHRVKVEGKDNIKSLKKKGMVVVSNHIHPLDIQAVMLFIFGMRKIHYFTLLKNFNLSVRFFLKNSGAVPIPIDKAEKKRCYEQMNLLLQENGVLYICPEGSLVSMCEEIRPFVGGAFRFANQNNVPILPVTLRFSLKNKKGKEFKYPKFTIAVSKPIYPSEGQDKLQQETERVMKQNCTQGYYGQAT